MTSDPVSATDDATPRRRWPIVALAVLVNLAVLPVSLVFLLIAVNSVNPMMLGFLSRTEILNQAGETLWVTPVAASPYTPERVCFETFLSPVFAWPVGSVRRHRLAPGESVEFLWDWDDMLLSEVVLEDVNGRLGWHDVLQLGKGQLQEIRHPANTQIVIGAVDWDRPMHAEALAATRHVEPWWVPPTWAILTAPWVHVLTLTWLGRLLWRRRARLQRWLGLGRNASAA